jgi:AcrR family transcriptional regulator
MGENAFMASPGQAPGHLADAPQAQPALGLRERKKKRTRTTIQREALRLFREQGYERTTIEQIAAAADVSPSTFFNYFPTKEDVVLTDEYDPLFISVFLGRPADESISTALRRTFAEVMPLMIENDRDLILARVRLSMEVPEVRARLFDELEKAQDLFRAVVAQRTGRDADDFDLRISLRMLIWAVEEAFLEWMRWDCEGDLLEILNRALDIVEGGARLD